MSTVSGLLNKPGLAVYAHAPRTSDPLLLADLADENERAAERVEAVRRPPWSGTASRRTRSATRARSRCAARHRRHPDGTRCVAASEDADLARQATREELIGQTVHVEGNRFTS